MDRVPYRRVTPPRHERTGAPPRGEHHKDSTENEASISHGETLIMQCILCGIILVFVLIVSMTNIAPALAVRGGIRQVLSGAETLDELVTDVRRFGAEWFGWDAPEEPYLDLTPGYDFYENLTPYDNEETLIPTQETDIFNEVESLVQENNNETRLADDPSNPTVPEPTVTPGLWD